MARVTVCDSGALLSHRTAAGLFRARGRYGLRHVRHYTHGTVSQDGARTEMGTSAGQPDFLTPLTPSPPSALRAASA
jgi:hypothetical protein